MNNSLEYTVLFLSSLLALILLFVIIPKLLKSSSKKKKVIILKSSVFLIIASSVFLFFTFYSNAKVVVKSKEISSYAKEEENYHIRPGELEILSYHIAYPERISKPIYTNNNELGFYIDGKWFYWADGKILTEEKMDKKSNYSPYLFFEYKKDMPEIMAVNEKNLEKVNIEISRRKNAQRDNDFLNTLYKGSNERQIGEHIELVSFIGFRVKAHSSIKDKLLTVSKEVKEIAKTDKEVADFLEGLKTVSGYVWKNVSKSSSRSHHSYGAAVDTLPKKSGSKQVYWAWTRVNNKNWYATPYDKRWMPPKSVVEIFEKHGFVWGGKWQFFDTIHFEYKPEIIIYNYLINNKNEIKKYL